MKQIFTISILCFTIGLYAQNSGASDDQSSVEYSYDEVIPDLTLLSEKSKIAPNPNPVFKKIRIDSSTNVKTSIVVGRVISTSILKDKLGIHHFSTNDDAMWTEPTIKNLEIHADSFVLDDHLHLPECNISIHARIVLMKDYTIKTFPLPYPQALANANSSGRKGRNGGNITIDAQRLEGSENGTYFRASGGTGEARYLPRVKLNLPTTAGTREVYKNHGCSDQSSFSTKTKFPKNCVAVYYVNDGGCKKYISYDDGIKFTDDNSPHSKIEDDDEDKRLQYKINAPGDGGNGGIITLNLQNNQRHNYNYWVSSGFGGKYLPEHTLEWNEDKTKSISYNCNGLPDVTINPQHIKINWPEEYGLYKYEVKGMWSIEANKKELERIIKIPSDAAVETLNKEIVNSWGKSGEKGDITRKQRQYLPSKLYQTMILRERYQNYKKLDDDFKKMYQDETQFLLSCTAAKLTSDLSEDEELEAYQSINDIMNLMNTVYLNVDEFGNGPGYRPMLSMNSVLSYIEKNGGIKDDIKTYILADLASKNEMSRGDFIKKIPERIVGFQKQLTKLHTNLLKLEQDSVRIMAKAAEVVKATEEVQKEFEKLTKIIKESAKKDKMIHEGSKKLLKTGAVAASIIPYGQPVLGAVVGNGLSALADEIKIDGGGSPSDIGLKVLSKIDYVTVAKDLSGRFEMSELEWTKKNKPKDKARILELTKKAKEEAKAAKAAADKAKAKNFDNYKKKYAKYTGYSTKGIQKAQEVFQSYAYASSSSKENDAFFTRLANRHIMYQELVRKLKNQNEKKEKLYSELNKILAKTKALTQQSVEIPYLIIELNELYNNKDNYHSEELEGLFNSITQNTLKRLEWIEYQLIKTYEYTTLSPYRDNDSATNGFITEYNRLLNENEGKLPASKIDTLVNDMYLFMKSMPRKVGQRILENVKNNKYEDSEGEEIILMNNNERESLANKKLNELNSIVNNYTTSIDLQQDLLGSVIRPDRGAIRIKQIVLDTIVFDQSFMGKVQLKMELGDLGVLRNGEDYYYFNTDQKSTAPNQWTWTINEKGKVTNPNRISSQYVTLISLLTDQVSNNIEKNRDVNSYLFTLPPAWTKLNLKLTHTGSLNSRENIPKVVELRFRVITSYKTESDNRKIIDVRQMNNLPMSSLDAKINNSKYEIRKGLYTHFTPGARITLNAPNDSVHKFERWDVYGDGGVLDSDALKKSTISFVAMNDLRIVAIFKDPIPSSSTEPQSKDLLRVFSTPSDDKEHIAEIEPDEIIRLKDDKADGFQRVLFGIEEGYIKEKK